MQHSKKIKCEFEGGFYNGAERYYTSYARALSAAKKYVNRCVDAFGYFDAPLVDVFRIEPDYKKTLLSTVGYLTITTY